MTELPDLLSRVLSFKFVPGLFWRTSSLLTLTKGV
jgi:hypothetical protein